LMRERGAELATTQMGRMGAEDPVGIAGGISYYLPLKFAFRFSRKARMPSF
jgi:hypothetical protein